MIEAVKYDWKSPFEELPSFVFDSTTVTLGAKHILLKSEKCVFNIEQYGNEIICFGFFEVFITEGSQPSVCIAPEILLEDLGYEDVKKWMYYKDYIELNKKDGE